jgi:hypothetical protein
MLKAKLSLKTTLHTFILMISISVVGCSSIPVEPFEKFSNSIKALEQGSNKALVEIIPMSEVRFKRDLISDIEEKRLESISKLIIDIDAEDPFKVPTVPLFLKAEQFKISVSRVNQVWVAYSNLLLQLASPDLISEEEFKQMSTDLNANALSAIGAIKSSSDDGDAKNAALFSEIGMSLAKNYLENKRESELAQILRENQVNVDEFVSAMHSAIITMMQFSAQEFTSKQASLSRTLISDISSNTGNKNDNKIDKAIDSLIDLNRDYLNQVSTLQSLTNAYSKISTAHASLSTIVDSSNLSLKSISELMEAGSKMHTSYEQKLAVNKASMVQAQADTAAAEANLLELKSQEAVLAASTAKFEYTKSLVAVKNNPGDNGLKAASDALKIKAEELQLKANDLVAQALEIRTAANTVIEKAKALKQLY